MKKTIAGLVLALSMPLVALATSVPAAAAVSISPVTDCSDDSIRAGLADLQNALATLEITGKNAEKDRAGLQNKVLGAIVRFEEKPLDAAQKLADVTTKLGELSDVGEISVADAEALTAAADAIRGCLAGRA